MTTIVRGELIRLFDVLGRNKDKAFSRRLAYALSRTKQMWAKEVRSFSEFQKPSEEYMEFDKKRVELLEKYGRRDPDGELVVDRQGRVSLETEERESFDLQVKRLEQDYKEVIEEQKNHSKEISSMLNDEVEVPVCQIPFEEIPEEINLEMMDVLYYMIRETKEIEE